MLIFKKLQTTKSEYRTELFFHFELNFSIIINKTCFKKSNPIFLQIQNQIYGQLSLYKC